MADYIDREALIKELSESVEPFNTGSVFRAINRQPAADVAPVRRGRWVDYMCRDWRCSVCGEKINKVRNVDGYCYDDKPNYCPNCGAKMDA